MVQRLGAQLYAIGLSGREADIGNRRQPVNMDGQVDVFRGKALLVLNFFVVKLAHGDTHHIAHHVKHRAARVALVDLGGELKSTQVITQPGALGDHAVG